MGDQSEHIPNREPPTSVEPQKLDYAVPPKKSYGRNLDGLIQRLTPPSDPELRQWWWVRFAYRVGLFAFFALIAFYFGPNMIEFGKLTRPTPADYVPLVEREGVPLVKALKLYKLDHGQFPKSESELVPDYLAKPGARFHAVDGTVFGYVGYQEMVEYDGNSATEGWYLSGPWASGRLPVPPAVIDPLLRPRTRPAG